MPAEPRARSLSPELPFKYVAGDVSLDLVNTVDWLADGLEHDRLSNYDRLTRWAEGAGVISTASGERLRRIAARRPRDAAAVVARAGQLRWTLQRLFAAIADGSAPGAALDELNEHLADALTRLYVVATTGRRGPPAALQWRDAERNLASPLWPVIWSATQLLMSSEAEMIRACAAPDCGWMYVDRSRNRLRRWCQMETCGTRAKNRRRAAH